jgi:hypothetical protein
MFSITIRSSISRIKHVPYVLSCVINPKFHTNRKSGGVAKPNDDLMIDTILIFESKSEGIFSFVLLLFRRVTLSSHIKSQLATLEKVTHTLSLKRVVIPIKNDVNGFRNFTLNHNETSTAKIDHKNEINPKNWVGSTWVAKSQLWKKSTLLVKSQRLVNAWSTEKSNAGQPEKSTLVQQKSQRSTLGQMWHYADATVTCLGQTWHPGGVTRGREEVLAHGGACKRVTTHRNFRRRVRARPVSESAVFCAVESSVSRSFQRYRWCRDRSPRTTDPRVAVGLFGDESASWQGDNRISDGGSAGDS